MEINSSWEIICKRHPRMIALSKAAAMGVLRPPAQNPEDDGTHNWERIFQTQESLFHTRFKNQVVLGASTHDPATSWNQATEDITDRAASAYLANTPLATSVVFSTYSCPWKHPSVLKYWLDQGASYLQRTFSHISYSANFVSFVQSCSETSPVRTAIFRAKQNMYSKVPLTVLPNKPERSFDNDEFQWYLADRIQAPQPTSLDISALSCDCKIRAPINNGRHFRLCTMASHSGFHNKIRDELFLMCRSAGIPTIKEPLHLLPDEPLLRPGDLYIPCWSTNGSTMTKHAIDFTAPSVDCRWDRSSASEKSRRCSTSGWQACSSVASKLTNSGSTQDRLARGNNLPMVSRCKQQGINFWPIALEKDGCPSPSFLAFFKNVCDTAGKFTDQNPSSFRNYWFTRLACKFNHHIASLGLQRSISFRRTLLRCQQTDFNLQNTVQAQMTLPIHHYNVIPASTTINTLPSFSSRFRHGRHA
jgi:hypothetical protein